MVKQQRASRTMGCAWVGQQQQPLLARMRSRPPHSSSSSSRSSPTDAPPSNPSAAATPMQPSTTPAASAPPIFSIPRRLATAACALWASAGGAFVLPLSGPAGHSLHPPAAIAATTTTTMLPPLPQLSSPPLPMLLVAGVAADSDAKPAVLLLPIAKVEAAIAEIGALIKVS